jgi:hypothetical protein
MRGVETNTTRCSPTCSIDSSIETTRGLKQGEKAVAAIDADVAAIKAELAKRPPKAAEQLIR